MYPSRLAFYCFTSVNQPVGPVRLPILMEGVVTLLAAAVIENEEANRRTAPRHKPWLGSVFPRVQMFNTRDCEPHRLRQ